MQEKNNLEKHFDFYLSKFLIEIIQKFVESGLWKNPVMFALDELTKFMIYDSTPDKPYKSMVLNYYLIADPSDDISRTGEYLFAIPYDNYEEDFSLFLRRFIHSLPEEKDNHSHINDLDCTYVDFFGKAMSINLYDSSEKSEFFNIKTKPFLHMKEGYGTERIRFGEQPCLILSLRFVNKDGSPL